MALDVGYLPGGKTATYVCHIISAQTEAVGTYARYAEKSPEVILASFKASISSTLTDRAEKLDSQILQLNCNIHPLDSELGLSGSCYGNDGSAAYLIIAVSVLR